MKGRKSGILLHITSLPGKYGIGTFGEEAYKFVDFLVETDQTYWQILPLGHTGFGDSPYSSYSAFAGNPLMIDLENIPLESNLKEYDHNGKVNFEKVKSHKFPLLKESASLFLKSDVNKEAFKSFVKDNNYWLEDYCFFMGLKNQFGQKPFWLFDEKLKFRDNEIVQKYKEELEEEIELYKVIQFFFFEQWYKLKSYANSKGIKIIGDIPLYVAGDSVDVWQNPELFMLNNDLTPIKVAGVPPDYFAATGQLWGNPVYDWESNKKTNYEWWIERINMNLKMFDIVRIDHFRGFSEFWAVPFGDETAEHGEWLPGPEDGFLDRIFEQREKFIAEDLGLLTDGVIRLLDKYQLPGMKILQFAFNSDSGNPFLPHNYTKNCVVYTGTHDNDTSMGIYKTYTEDELNFLNEYFVYDEDNYAHYLMKYLWASVADTAIAPLQDLFRLDGAHRMNTPATIGGNWEWIFNFDDIKTEHIGFLKGITKTYGRK